VLDVNNFAVCVDTSVVDPSGSVTVRLSSTPNGQGHATVAAQIVADIFGLAPEAVAVDAAIDTGKDAWSIAAGNYSSRFAGATAGAVHLAATRLRNRLAGIAAAQLNALLIQHPVHPQLSGHDGQRWHVHYRESGSVADKYAAGAVMGLAVRLTDLGIDRFGVCQAPGCLGVFIDVSTSNTRRYCSDRCMNRANVSAFRARKRGEDDADTKAPGATV